MEEAWLRKRDKAYERFVEDLEIGYVDSDIRELIEYVFRSKRRLFTTSSCSGRITIVDSKYPWLREEAHVLFKRHQPITARDVEEVLARERPIYRLWLVVSGPILHFVTATIDDAEKLLTELRKAGFKHSGIISMGRGGTVVEAVTGIWVPFLLKEGDKVFVTDLAHLVSLANNILLEGKARLERLFKALKELDI